MGRLGGWMDEWMAWGRGCRGCACGGVDAKMLIVMMRIGVKEMNDLYHLLVLRSGKDCS